MEVTLVSKDSMRDMYVYAYYAGEKIPDVGSIILDGNVATITLTALPDKFTDWFRDLPEEGDLELRMDNVDISLQTLYDVGPHITGIKSVLDEFTEITLQFK